MSPLPVGFPVEFAIVLRYNRKSLCSAARGASHTTANHAKHGVGITLRECHASSFVVN